MLFLYPSSDYCIKTVLTKRFLFVCAAFLVHALHEMLHSFYVQVTDIVPNIKLLYMNYDIRFHNGNKILERSCASHKSSNKMSKSHLEFCRSYN